MFFITFTPNTSTSQHLNNQPTHSILMQMSTLQRAPGLKGCVDLSEAAAGPHLAGPQAGETVRVKLVDLSAGHAPPPPHHHLCLHLCFFPLIHPCQPVHRLECNRLECNISHQLQGLGLLAPWIHHVEPCEKAPEAFSTSVLFGKLTLNLQPGAET